MDMRIAISSCTIPYLTYPFVYSREIKCAIMADKSGESDELISQFMAFTGSADPEKAASYLEMSGNNVETAVGLFMEHEQGGGDLGGGGVASAVGGAGRTGDDIRAPDATRTMRLMDDDHRGPMMGMGMMGHMGIPQDPAYHLMSAMMEMDEQSPPSTFSVAAPDINIRASLDEAIAAQRQHSALQEGKDDGDYHDEDDDEDCEVVARPQEPARLSDMFAAPNHLLHRAGGFQGSRTMAKDTKRWLLVNIQRDAEFASHALNRDVWRDELVENLIREGFIFWQQVHGNSLEVVLRCGNGLRKKNSCSHSVIPILNRWTARRRGEPTQSAIKFAITHTLESLIREPVGCCCAGKAGRSRIQ